MSQESSERGVGYRDLPGKGDEMPSHVKTGPLWLVRAEGLL
jgi:hypothetical protein